MPLWAHFAGSPAVRCHCVYISYNASILDELLILVIIFHDLSHEIMSCAIKKERARIFTVEISLVIVEALISLRGSTQTGRGFIVRETEELFQHYLLRTLSSPI